MTDVSILGGSDGPTSVFIAGHKHSLKQKLQKLRYKIKRQYVEKHIISKHHNMDEVCCYLVKKYGFVEIASDVPEFLEEYENMRASFLIKYAPELLGKYANVPKLKNVSKENIQKYIKQNEKRLEIAKEIPKKAFDIDFHKFQRIFPNSSDSMDIIIEKKYSYIGGGAIGNKKLNREFRKIYKDVYKYYGVTQKDIKNKTERYKSLVKTLSN